MEMVKVTFGKKNGELFEVRINWKDESPFQLFQRRMTPMLENTTFDFPLERLEEIYSFMRSHTSETHNPFYLASTWKVGSHLAFHSIVRINHERFFVVKNLLVSLDGSTQHTIDNNQYYEVVGQLSERELSW